MAKWGFDTALYSVPPEDRARSDTDPALARNAFANFRQEGRRLVLVAGEPAWVKPAARVDSRLPAPILRLLDLASKAGSVEGIALDIEPHALPEWKTNDRPLLARGFVDIVRNARTECASRKLALWGALHPSQAATPDPDGRLANLAAALIAHLDVAVTMAYRNNVDHAVAFANRLIDELALRGTAWYFGLTTQQSAQAASISYYGFDPDQFAAAVLDLDEAVRRGAGGRTYRGIAVHQFTTAAHLLS